MSAKSKPEVPVISFNLRGVFHSKKNSTECVDDEFVHGRLTFFAPRRMAPAAILFCCRAARRSSNSLCRCAFLSSRLFLSSSTWLPANNNPQTQKECSHKRLIFIYLWCLRVDNNPWLPPQTGMGDRFM